MRLPAHGPGQCLRRGKADSLGKSQLHQLHPQKRGSGGRSPPMSTPLYNAIILRLAASIPHEGRLAAPGARVEKRSQVCGSRIVVDIVIDSEDRITALGQQVSACALGQASAALMGAHAIGRTATEIAEARAALADYLAGLRDDPGPWPGLDVFAPARAHRSRHTAILLPFEAVAQAARDASA